MFIWEVTINHRTLKSLELMEKPLHERWDATVDELIERQTRTGVFATDTPDLMELQRLIEKYWLGKDGFIKTQAVIESIKLIADAVYDYKD